MDEFIKLTTAEQAFIVKYLALKRPYPKIKTDFTSFFEKKISGEQIMQFEATNKSIIEKVSKREMNDIKSCKLAHSRVRLDILEEALEWAVKPKVVRSYRISDTEWATETDVDASAIAKLVQLARDEEFMYKKLFIELKKFNLQDDAEEFITTGYKVEVDTGIPTLTDEQKK